MSLVTDGNEISISVTISDLSLVCLKLVQGVFLKAPE